MQKFEWLVKHDEVEDLLITLLDDRGVDEEQIPDFLHPNWERDTYDAFVFKQMNQAVDCIFEALSNKKKIVIHGDYDADGVCGSALLYQSIREIADRMSIDPNIHVFLPDREKDGYGVAMHTIERLAEEETSVLITVDCGIANIAELNRAHELGIQTIICDHHQLAANGDIPNHAIIIHPLAPGEDYPNKHLCGTGVAFKLASALFSEARNRGAEFPIGHEKWYLDFVAIATVTDVMPLLGENRTLEKYGLIVLKKTRRPGLLRILEISRTSPKQIDTTAIGFRIGPRLNAAGRISSAEKAFKALIAEYDTAADHALELEQLNRERQQISDRAFREAKKIVKEINEQKPIHVVWTDHWNPGIVGLVAGKLVTEFGVPAFALTKVGDHYVGSGRSVGGLHLVEAMQSCGDIFIKAGGHPQACGLTLPSLDSIAEFQKGVESFALEYFGEDIPKPHLQVDAIFPIQDIDWHLVENLEKMEPFGHKNPKPVFLSKNVQVMNARPVGKTGRHLKMTVNPQSGDLLECIGFGLGSLHEKLNMGTMIDMVYEVGVNEWNGRRQIQLSVNDINLLS